MTLSPTMDGSSLSEQDRMIAKNGDLGQGERLMEKKKALHAKK